MATDVLCCVQLCTLPPVSLLQLKPKNYVNVVYIRHNCPNFSSKIGHHGRGAPAPAVLGFLPTDSALD